MKHKITTTSNNINLEEYERVVNELEKAKRILKQIKDEFKGVKMKEILSIKLKSQVGEFKEGTTLKFEATENITAGDIIACLNGENLTIKEYKGGELPEGLLGRAFQAIPYFD